jgi:hypothetical protein
MDDAGWRWTLPRALAGPFRTWCKECEHAEEVHLQDVKALEDCADLRVQRALRLIAVLEEVEHATPEDAARTPMPADAGIRSEHFNDEDAAAWDSLGEEVLSVLLAKARRAEGVALTHYVAPVVTRLSFPERVTLWEGLWSTSAPGLLRVPAEVAELDVLPEEAVASEELSSEVLEALAVLHAERDTSRALTLAECLEVARALAD